jgi:hypothetical protein
MDSVTRGLSYLWYKTEWKELKLEARPVMAVVDYSITRSEFDTADVMFDRYMTAAALSSPAPVLLTC